MRRAVVLRSLLVSVALCLVGTASVLAYTVETNNYPNSPLGCTNAYDAATNQTWYCVRWAYSASGYSSDVYVYLDPSLSPAPGQGNPDEPNLNLKQEALNAFTRWNSVPARSPFFHQASGLITSTGYAMYGYPTKIVRDNSVRPPYLAWTSFYTMRDLTGSGDPHKILFGWVSFSSTARFGPHGNIPPGQYDATEIMMHELGHLLGLGHSGAQFKSLMYPDQPNPYTGVAPTTVSGGDVPGLQFLYGPGFCDYCVPPG
jgi:hypothetical protein